MHIYWGDKVKKKLLLVLVLFGSFLVTGCTVDYNLSFNDSELKETININLIGSENTEENIEKMKYSLENEAVAISKRGIYKIYEFSDKQDKDKYIGSFTYNYSTTEFNDAHIIRQCYDSFNFVKTEKGYQLITSDIFRCGSYSYMMVDKYTITITTNHKVIENNADQVDKNKYIWVIENNNDSVNINKPIKIVFSNETNLEQLSNDLASNSKIITFAVIGIISCAIIIVTIVFVIKSKKNGN